MMPTLEVACEGRRRAEAWEAMGGGGQVHSRPCREGAWNVLASSSIAARGGAEKPGQH